MAEKSNIEWTDASWNPVSGCTEVSPGCDNCYARELAERYRGSPAWPNGFDVTLKPHKLKEPLKWKEPKRIFVNSMSDLFHREIPDDYLRRVWDVMLEADQHTYQILTKRPHRMGRKIADLRLETRKHIWLGTSVENQTFADNRIPALIDIDTPVRFLSCEPLLGPIDLLGDHGAKLDLLTEEGPNDWPVLAIHWVIVGGESGRFRRPFDRQWARDIRDAALRFGAAFFFKQGSALRPGEDGLLDGREWNEMPDAPASTPEPVDHQLEMVGMQ